MRAIDMKSVVLGPLRRRGRPVAWTPEFMGWGNLLQLGQWAFDGTQQGDRRWFRATPKLLPWLDVFPGLRTFALLESEIRFTDQRVMPWSASQRAAGASRAVPSHEQVDFSSVQRFLEQVVMPGSQLAERAGTRRDDTLVINVRRGDYYSNAEIRAQYGFDTATYVAVAVAKSIELDGMPAEIQVVSDDPDWCRAHLAWLGEINPTTFGDSGDPVHDFVAIATARRLVITNSTFSYWGAYMSNVLHATNHASVVAPRFFDRSQNAGRSWMLDPRWTIIDDIPGGWDSGANS